MATVINNPADGTATTDSGMGVIVGVIVALVLLALFFVYALPALRGSGAAPQNGGASINVDLPNPNPAPSPNPQQ